MEMARVQTILGPYWNRGFNAQTMLTVLTQKSRTHQGLWIRDCVYRACYCLPTSVMPYGISRPFRKPAARFYRDAERQRLEQKINQCCVGILRFGQRGSSGWPKSMRTSP